MRATATGTGVLAAFSPAQDYLAVVTPDGRLKTFDTATGRVAANVPNAGGAGAGPPGALCWAIAEPPAPGQPAPLLAVVGCADGAARAYAASSGDLAWAAPASAPGLGGVVALTSRAGAPGDPIFAACAGGRAVAALRPSDGGGGAAPPAAAGRTQPTALAAAPDASGRLAVGSTGVTVYESTSGRRAGRHAGHAGGSVRALAWAPGGLALLSAGGGDRAAAVWTGFDASESARHAPAAALLPLDGGAVPGALAAAADPSGGGASFRAAALADSGASARVWQVCHPAAPSVTRLADVAPPGGPRTGAGGPGAARLLAVGLAADGRAVVIASGAPGAPSIERLPLPSDPPASPLALVAGGGGSPVALVNGGDAVGSPPGAKAAAANGGRGVSVLEPGAAGGPTRAGVAKRARPPAPGEGGGAASVATPQPVANGHRAGPSDDDEDDEEGGEGSAPTTTLGARLAALGVPAGGPVPARPPADGGKGDPLAGPAPPRAGTLATLLSQALRAEDTALLERCLTAGAAAAARPRGRARSALSTSSLTATVAALAPADAGALLRALVSRLRSRASRGGGLAPWLAATLHCHAAYLVAAPGAARPLADLCDALAARSAVAPALSSLAGRLDLLLAQAGGGAAAARDAAAAAAGLLPGGGSSDDDDADDTRRADDEYRESEDEDLAAAAAAELGSDFDEDDGGDSGSGGGESEWSTEDEVDEDDEGEGDGMEF